MIDARVEILNPFPGLRSFNEQESHLFFGREAQVDGLLLKLRRHRFIAVIGMSGSGKSSLIKAGLIPALRSGFMTEIGSNWEVALCRVGEDPIRNLARALYHCDLLDIKDAQPEGTQLDILQTKLKRSGNALVSLVEESRMPSNDNLMIVIDQFEEIFQYMEKGEEETATAWSFIQLLLEAIEQSDVSIYVVLTMRSDFIDHCSTLPGLIDAINDSQYIIPPMTREQLRLAIVGPVQVGGSLLNKVLEQQLLNDLDGNPDQLPILQHAMMRTWDYWKAEQGSHQHLEAHHYEAIGTMERGLSLHAEEAYHELNEEQKLLAQKVFQSITQQRSQGVGVRRPTQLGVIIAVTGSTLPRLTEVTRHFAQEGRSFLMAYNSGERESNEWDASTIIDISHESIMRLWGRLRDWVEKEAAAAQVYLRLCASAEAYDQGRTGLLKDPELTLSLRWYEQHNPTEDWAVRYDPSFQRAITYLVRSKEAQEWEIAQKEAEQRRKLKRSRAIAIVFGLLSIISVFFLVSAIVSQVEANKNLNKAKQEQSRAEESRQQALKEREKAMSSEQEAFRQKEKALENEQLAREQSEIARQNAALAREQEALARENARKARRQADIAEEERQKAEEQEKIATEKRKEAERQERIANEQRKRANDLRMRAIAKTLAASSIRIIEPERSNDKAALALQAYAFNQAFDGEKDEPTIFEALLKADEQLNIGEAKIYEDHQAAVTVIEQSPNGRFWLSGSIDGRIVWKDRQTGEVRRVESCNNGRCGVRQLAFSPNTEKAFASVHQNKEVLLWTLGNKKPLKFEGHGEIVRAVAFSKDGKLLYTGDVEGKVGVWDTEAPVASASKQWLDLKERLTAILPHPNNNGVVLVTEQGNAYTFMMGNSQAQPLISNLGKVLSATLTPDGKQLVTGNALGRLNIINLATGEMEDYSEHNSGITGVSISPNGKMMATCSFDKSVKIYDYDNMSKAPINLRVNDWVHDVQFAPDGNSVLFASADHQIYQTPIKLNILADAICEYLENTTVDSFLWETLAGEDIPQQQACP